MGNKVLRQRPRGPALAAYYPRKVLTVKDMHREFRPVMDFYDEEEGRRLEHLASYVSVPLGTRLDLSSCILWTVMFEILTFMIVFVPVVRAQQRRRPAVVSFMGIPYSLIAVEYNILTGAKYRQEVRN